MSKKKKASFEKDMLAEAAALGAKEEAEKTAAEDEKNQQIIGLKASFAELFFQKEALEHQLDITNQEATKIKIQLHQLGAL